MKILLICILLLASTRNLTDEHYKPVKNPFKVEQIKEEVSLEQEMKEYYENNPVYETITHERDIFLVNYYPNDADGSGTTTASGLRTSDFRTTVEGFYTYKGYLVLAGPTSDELFNYKLYNGYKKYKLYDIATISFTYRGQNYVREGIFLDVCGACYGLRHETKQRIDIFTAYPTVGKIDAKEITYDQQELKK